MLLRQQKASSNFLNIDAPSSIPGVLYYLVLPLDCRLASVRFWGAFSVDSVCQCHYFRTCVAPMISVGRGILGMPCCWWKLSLAVSRSILGRVQQLRWRTRQRGEEVVENRAGALESCVVPGICCPRFTRTASSSSLDWLVSCSAFYVETSAFIFLWGILEILENGSNWLSLVV